MQENFSVIWHVVVLFLLPFSGNVAVSEVPMNIFVGSSILIMFNYDIIHARSSLLIILAGRLSLMLLGAYLLCYRNQNTVSLFLILIMMLWAYLLCCCLFSFWKCLLVVQYVIIHAGSSLLIILDGSLFLIFLQLKCLLFIQSEKCFLFGGLSYVSWVQLCILCMLLLCISHHLYWWYAYVGAIYFSLLIILAGSLSPMLLQFECMSFV